MNEKKAIVFFFVVVFFFSCLLLVVVVVASSTYVTYVFLSFVLCFGCVCVFFFSSSFASLTCASVCSYVCDCVCVCLSISTFCCCCCFFFGGLTVSNAALLAHFVSSFSFLRCNSRGSLSPLFFSRIEQNTYTRAHVQTRTHRRTDGRREKSARAPLVLRSTHKTILRFLLLCVIAIIMIGCCCYSLFMGCFLALLINRDRVRYMHTLS